MARTSADEMRSTPTTVRPAFSTVSITPFTRSVWAAATCPPIAAAVTYYYVMPHGKPDFTRIRGPVQGHFGTADEFIPLEASKGLEQELRDAGVDVSFYYYDDAGHAFFNDTNRLGTYDEEAARLAWERTVPFLRSALAPAG